MEPNPSEHVGQLNGQLHPN